MKRINTLITLLAFGACVALGLAKVHAHGDVTPQPVNTDSLPPIGEEWLTENPYRGNAAAIEVGASAYNQNCARCHGLEVISGGITPDLRKLNSEDEFDSVADSDEWYMERVRNGAVINGNIYMPPFEGLMNQEAMWAIRAYIDTQEYTD